MKTGSVAEVSLAEKRESLSEWVNRRIDCQQDEPVDWNRSAWAVEHEQTQAKVFGCFLRVSFARMAIFSLWVGFLSSNHHSNNCLSEV
jgi:hypothetical protein